MPAVLYQAYCRMDTCQAGIAKGRVYGKAGTSRQNGTDWKDLLIALVFILFYVIILYYL